VPEIEELDFSEEKVVVIKDHDKTGSPAKPNNHTSMEFDDVGTPKGRLNLSKQKGSKERA